MWSATNTVDYPHVLEYLFSRLPMFHRIGPAAYKADLSNTYALMDMTGHPYKNFPCIHIAGTNGKGSTSHLLAAVLQESGHKVGLYTSPHLLDFRERIRVNGEMIPESAVAGFVQKYKEQFEPIEPSFFEWTVALAFSWFAEQQVDVAVIETGLGGRLDSTNVIRPVLSVITNIGWDHASLLGDTLEKIAGEKAGIIKTGIPVVIGERDPQTADVFLHHASQSGSEILFASDCYVVNGESVGLYHQDIRVDDKSTGKPMQLRLGLPGRYQWRNAATVLAAIDGLRKSGWSIPEHAVPDGFRNVRRLTGLSGRWQVVNEKPLVVVDVAHNEPGMRLLVDQLSEQRHGRLFFVTGMVRDKDVSAVLQVLPVHATYFFCQPDLPRALPVDELAEKAASFGLQGRKYPSVKDAIRSALDQAGDDDLVMISGSTFVVAEALPLFKEA